VKGKKEGRGTYCFSEEGRNQPEVARKGRSYLIRGERKGGERKVPADCLGKKPSCGRGERGRKGGGGGRHYLLNPPVEERKKGGKRKKNALFLRIGRGEVERPCKFLRKERGGRRGNSHP